MTLDTNLYLIEMYRSKKIKKIMTTPNVSTDLVNSLALWLSQNVTCVDNRDDASALLVVSSLTNSQLWDLEGPVESRDLHRMYAGYEDDRPCYSHWWVGNPKSPNFWANNAYKILKDEPHAGQVVVQKLNGQRETFDIVAIAA